MSSPSKCRHDPDTAFDHERWCSMIWRVDPASVEKNARKMMIKYEKRVRKKYALWTFSRLLFSSAIWWMTFTLVLNFQWYNILFDHLTFGYTIKTNHDYCQKKKELAELSTCLPWFFMETKEEWGRLVDVTMNCKTKIKQNFNQDGILLDGCWMAAVYQQKVNH